MALGITALLAWQAGQPKAGGWFLIAGLLYTLGGIVFTATINVPMNEALAVVIVPDSIEEARTIWQDYSSRWQLANITRTVISGVCVLFTAVGLSSLRRSQSPTQNSQPSPQAYQGYRV